MPFLGNCWLGRTVRRLFGGVKVKVRLTLGPAQFSLSQDQTASLRAGYTVGPIRALGKELWVRPQGDYGGAGLAVDVPGVGACVVMEDEK